MEETENVLEPQSGLEDFPVKKRKHSECSMPNHCKKKIAHSSLEARKAKGKKIAVQVFGKDAKPSLKLTLENVKKSQISIKEIKDLILSMIGVDPIVKWSLVISASKIKRVVVILVDSLDYATLQSSKESLKFFFDTFDQIVPCRTYMNNNNVIDGTSVLLRKKNSNESSLNHKMNIQEQHKNFIKKLEESGESLIKEKPNVKEKIPAVSEKKLTDVTMGIVEDIMIHTKANISCNPTDSSTEKMKVSECLMSKLMMSKAKYPLPCEGNSEYVIIKQLDNPQIVEDNAPMFAIDCEMCETTKGIELVRVSVVDKKLNLVYDSFAKPANKIIDYHTRFHGITAEYLDNVTKTLTDVQNELLEILTSDCILVGHSLENDLLALRMIHLRVIDTAYLYPHQNGTYYKHSLRYLAKKWLHEDIQTHNHDPSEDARTAMKLVLLKLKFGDEVGYFLPNNYENFCEYLYRIGKSTAIIDSPLNCKLYAGSHTDIFAANMDSEIVDNSIDPISSCRYDFLFIRLNSIVNYHTALEGDPFDYKYESKVDRDVITEICKKIDDNIQKIYRSITKGTLVIVTGGNGNLARLNTLNTIKKKGQNVDRNIDAMVSEAMSAAQTTFAAFKVKN